MKNKQKVEQKIATLNSRGFACAMDSNINGLRLTTKSGNRDISPRLRPKEMLVFLEGFVSAIDELAASHMTKP